MGLFPTMKLALLALAELVLCWVPDLSDRDANLTHVYPMNYVFAETTEFMRFAAAGFDLLLGQHGINVFKHFHSTDMPIKFPMMNKDTIYSAAVIDTHTGPVRIELPESDRYMSICCMNQDHYVEYY